ncbi:hypothetical protein BD779DRAFT_1464905 [Infundibulicybe gibba]|nr:hypothetical protein BD779DRAFT_1464905 [Infundibulicybe gibba]
MSKEDNKPEADNQTEEKQCRICFDGFDPELGRLIRPCLCKGSISKWRNTSAKGAFFSCPQCHYNYRFTRTKVVGIATNPAIVGSISAIVFTAIVLLSSFITTFFMSDPTVYEPTASYFPFIYIGSPFQTARDLIRAALRILQDEDVMPGPGYSPGGVPKITPRRTGVLWNFCRRFILGLPIVGAGSLVHMLLSAPFLGPIHWLARYRGNRRRDNSRDIAAAVIIFLLVLGALRALYKVYELTQSMTKRLLLRAEDAILEVN